MTCWNTSLSICQPCNVTKKKGFFCVLFLEHSPLWDVTSHFNYGCVHSSHKQLQADSLDEFSFSAQKIVPASVFFCLSWRNQSDWIKRWTKIQSLSIKQFFFFSTLMFIGIFYNKAKHNTTKQQQQQQSTRLPMVTVAYYKKKKWILVFACPSIHMYFRYIIPPPFFPLIENTFYFSCSW